MIVYIATNRLNGKRYIGATVTTLANRAAQHIGSKRRSCRHFHAALAKHGPAAFEWEVLRECLSVDEMYEAEISLIRSMKPEYNISPGGKSPLIGLKRTPEWVAKMAAANKGRKPSALCMAIARERASRPRRPVVCINDGEVFGGLVLASRRYGIPVGKIVNVTKGREVSTKGLVFRYWTGPITSEQRTEIMASVAARLGAMHEASAAARRRPICCLDDGLVYPSTTDAAKFYGIGRCSITNALRPAANGGKRKAGGKRFVYAEVT